MLLDLLPNEQSYMKATSFQRKKIQKQIFLCKLSFDQSLLPYDN